MNRIPSDHSFLSEEFSGPRQNGSVPLPRILHKTDEYLGRRDYAGAERHLLYWLEEARQVGDERGELSLHSELIGHYRKTASKTQALSHAESALALLEKTELDNTLSAGTIYINIATAMNSFGENERALTFFEKARKLYESAHSVTPDRLGGLYNNMALALASVHRYAEAAGYFEKALEQMKLVENGELEQAVTCLNLADLVAQRDGMEAGETRIFELLDEACALLETPHLPRNGYYAFVCEKCAPVFSYYGYFAEEEFLRKEAERIYAGT